MRTSIARALVCYIAALFVACGCSDRRESSTAAPSGESYEEAVDGPATVVVAKQKAPAPRKPQNPPEAETTGTPLRKAKDNQVRVQGRVTHADGSAASGAMVSLMRHGSGIGRSETITTGVVAGGGEYEVAAENFYPLALLVSGDFPETYVLLDHGRNFSTKPGPRDIRHDVVIPESHALQGRVIGADGNPLQDIAVHLTPSFGRTPEQNKNDTRRRKFSKTTSTAEGKFAFPHLSAGLWIVGAKVDGWAPVSLPVQLPVAEPITIQLGSKGGSVTGTVLHKQTNEGLGNIKVSAVSGDMNQLVELETQETRTDANGIFTINNLSTGPLRLMAEADGDRKLWMTTPHPAPLNLQDGQTTAATIYLYPGHTITGKVYDKDTGEPLPGASLSTISQGRKAQVISDREGHFRFDNISNQWTSGAGIDIQLDGYQLATETPSQNGKSIYAKLPEDGSPVHLDLPMVQMVEVRGRVVTEDEVPVSNAKVRFSGGGEQPPLQTVNADGSFTVYARPFSRGAVEATAEGFVKQMKGPIEVASQPVDNIKIVMRLPAALQGRVVDSTGKPVEGADIHVTRWHGAGTGTGGTDGKSGSAGEYTISDLPEKVDLHAEKEGYSRSEEQTLTMKPGEARTDVELVLREDGKHSISGIVVLSADGKPVADEMVSVYPSAGFDSARTDKSGKFKLVGLPEGTYDLQVSGLRHKVVRGVKTGTENLRIEIETGEAPKATVTLVGTVVDDITGQAVRDFTVSQEQSRQQVERLNEPGRFRISGLSPHIPYTLTFTSPEHEKQQHKTEAGKDGETVEQTFRLTTPGAISGRVVNKGSNEPAPGLTVVNYGVGSNWGGISDKPVKHTTTDNEGKFTLAPAAVGKNQLKVLAPEAYADVTFEAEVKSGEVTSVDDVLIGGGATLEGQVVRGEQEAPVPGVAVHISSSEHNYREQTSADAEGRFRMAGLAAGHYSVSAEGALAPVLLEDSEVATVKLHIGTITVRGTVTRGGVPVQASVRARSADGHTLSGSNRQGQYELQNVLPGSYTFFINLPDGNVVQETVTIPDQPEVEKNFVLPDGRLLVRVVNQDGEPVQGQHVRVQSPALARSYGNMLFRSSESTGRDGTYVISGLPPGTYTVKTNGRLLKGVSEPSVEVIDGATAEVQLQVVTATASPQMPTP